jgi:uncharacterized protein YdiU (UPF0061 family)
VLATELLETLGVYTSKSFSLAEAGEQLTRNDEPSPTRSAVLVRLSHGHIRFGTFERLARLDERTALTRLCDFTMEHYVPQLANGARAGAPTTTVPEALFAEVAWRAATLAASWMAAGFVHGVLTTDNMNVTGESFDYGPWRFLPTLDPLFPAAYFDHRSLYAYARQPEAVRWSLERLAEAIGAPVPTARLVRLLADFEVRYLTERTSRLLERLGVEPRDPCSDAILAARVLRFLRRGQLPCDRLFFDWYGGQVAAPRAAASPFAAVYSTTGPAGDAYSALRQSLATRAPRHPERLRHPYLQRSGPATLPIDKAERVWRAIDERDDWGPFQAKVAELRELGTRCASPEPQGAPGAEVRAADGVARGGQGGDATRQ